MHVEGTSIEALMSLASRDLAHLSHIAVSPLFATNQLGISIKEVTNNTKLCMLASVPVYYVWRPDEYWCATYKEDSR